MNKRKNADVVVIGCSTGFNAGPAPRRLGRGCQLSADITQILGVKQDTQITKPPVREAALFEMTDQQWDDAMAFKLHSARRLALQP
jgi:hypothetical protein